MRAPLQVLAAMVDPLKRVRAQCTHSKVLPQLLRSCVDTKSAGVRVGCLQTLTGVAPRLTEQESDVCARMIKQLTATEASDTTLSHVLQVRLALQRTLARRAARHLRAHALHVCEC